MECWRDGGPYGRFYCLHRGTLELCQSDHRVLGHLPDQGPSPPIAQSLGGSKLLPFKSMKVFLGTFNAADIFWYPSPDLYLDTILSQSSMDNSFHLKAWFLLWHALSTVGAYIDSCVPFQIMINGNRMHLSSILSFITKGLNTYVNKVFLYLFLQTLLKTCFLLCNCGVLCVD